MRSTHMLLCLACASSAHAQSDIDPEHKHAWVECLGWTNWRDAGDPAGDRGARIHTTPDGGGFLSGMVWAENAGWITVGDGSPANGQRYRNSTGADAGVNIDPDGTLRGLAWGENIGWINFDTADALGPHGQEARLDQAALRLRGYAWSENTGWVNLDDRDHFVAFSSPCVGDFDGDGRVDTRDVLAFLNAWAAGEARADINDDGVVDTRDVLAFLNAWAAGCP